MNDGDIGFGVFLGLLLGLALGAVGLTVVMTDKMDEKNAQIVELKKEFSLERECLLKGGVWNAKTRTCTIGAVAK